MSSDMETRMEQLESASQRWLVTGIVPQKGAEALIKTYPARGAAALVVHGSLMSYEDVSEFSYKLACAAARGKEFLISRAPQASRVLYVKYLPRGVEHDYRLANVRFLQWEGDVLNTLPGRMAIASLARETRADLVVIEEADRAFGYPSQHDEFKNNLIEFIQCLDASVLFIHRLPEQVAGPWLRSYNVVGTLANVCDVLIELHQDPTQKEEFWATWYSAWAPWTTDLKLPLHFDLEGEIRTCYSNTLSDKRISLENETDLKFFYAELGWQDICGIV